MVDITQDDVAHLAGLARIALRNDEIVRLTNDLNIINHAIDKIQEVATEDVQATSHPIEINNVFREDIPATEHTVTDQNAHQANESSNNPFAGDLLSHNSAISGGPQTENGQFVTPKILGED